MTWRGLILVIMNAGTPEEDEPAPSILQRSVTDPEAVADSMHRRHPAAARRPAWELWKMRVQPQRFIARAR
jgi:hypothetical protein